MVHDRVGVRVRGQNRVGRLIRLRERDSDSDMKSEEVVLALVDYKLNIVAELVMYGTQQSWKQ